MKLIVAVGLVIVSYVAAEPPTSQGRAFRQNAPQENAPYQTRGWRPNGPQFSLPQRQVSPSFYASPPPQEYGAPQTDTPTTTTELTTTTTEVVTEATNFDIQAENIVLPSKKADQKLEKIEETPASNPVYVIIPQTSQKLVYSSPVRLITPVTLQTPSEGIMAQKQEIKPAPIQAIPVLAKIQAPAEQYPQYGQVLQFQNLQAYSLGSYSQNTVVTPYSASFVQIYQ